MRLKRGIRDNVEGIRRRMEMIRVKRKERNLTEIKRKEEKILEMSTKD